MQPKVELNKVRSFSEIIDDSILFFKQNWKPLLRAYFAICGFFWVAGLITSTFNQFHTFQLKAQGESPFGITYFISILFAMFSYISISLTTLSYISLYHQKDKEAPTVEEVWGYVKFYFLRVTGTFFLLTLLLVLGFVFCFFPGIYLWPVFSLILTIMILENASLNYAFNRAFRLISDNWWHTFGVLLLISLLIGVTMILVLIPAAVIATLIVFVTGTHGREVYEVALNIAVNLVQFLHILVLIAGALVYYSLTEQKEDVSLMERIKQFGTHTPPTQQPGTDEEY